MPSNLKTEEPNTQLKDLKCQVDLLINLVAEMGSVATQAEAMTAREAEQIGEDFIAEMALLEARLREKEGILVSREALLETLKSEMAALIEEMTQLRRDKDRMSSESERLRSELKQRKLLLAKAEADEWRSIGRRNSWKRWLGALGKLPTKPAEEQEAGNLTRRLPLTSS